MSCFEVRGIVSSNHVANVSSFNILLQDYAHKDARFNSAFTKFMQNIFVLRQCPSGKKHKKQLLNVQKFFFQHFASPSKIQLWHHHKRDTYHGENLKMLMKKKQN